MTCPPDLKRIHHVAYRCKNAKATVEWYERALGMNFTTAFAEDHVPSTGAHDPYMHVFLDCGGGNILAFFELPSQPEMTGDPNTPAWVPHLAFEVCDEEALLQAKTHLEAMGISVVEGDKFVGPSHQHQPGHNHVLDRCPDGDAPCVKWVQSPSWRPARYRHDLG